MSTGLIIIVAASVLFIIIIISIYNKMIRLKNHVEYANGSLDAMFKKRYDLIPNLIAAVKQYMQYEHGLLNELTELRVKAQSRNLSEGERNNLDSQLNSALKHFNVAVENYPDIKAGEQFTMLQESLNETEAQLSAARRTYNAAVMDYNNAVEMFPTNIFASIMHYSRKQMIAIDEFERTRPNVQGLFD